VINPFGWLFGGKLCKRCGEERTGNWVVDDMCDTCYYVLLIKTLMGLK